MKPLPIEAPRSYRSFSELLNHEVEGRDFKRIVRECDSHTAIVAPHGGGIEPGTSEIAKALAGNEYSLYCFESLKRDGNEILHITSHEFDDPLCTRIMQSAKIVVSIHGCGCEEDKAGIFVGGRHGPLRRQLITSLRKAGFEAISDDGRHPGIHTGNICNQGQTGAGIQLEISLGVRRSMFAGMSRVERQVTKPLFRTFVDTVRLSLETHNLFIRYPG